MGKGHRRSKKQHKSQVEPSDFFIGYYALAFIDILNQKEKLSKITKLPENEQEELEFIQQWKDTLGVVRGFRNTFDQFFTAYGDENITIPTASREERDFIRRCTRVEIRRESFSDTMIYYSSVKDGPNQLGISAIHSLFAGCSAAFLLTLSMGFTCRGGIEVDIAGELGAGDLYGPALYKAHHLESEDADYPRIAVGEGLMQFIGTEMSRSGQDQRDAVRRGIAGICREWIVRDVDGIHILDYAGKTAKNALAEIGSYIDPSIAFVESEWQRFRSEHNTKLAGRYFLLRNYLANRKQQVWK